MACEDTRVSRTLLQRAGIRPRCVALHAHNEARQAPALLEAISAGGRVALISDAGTPAISDPGARLVTAAQARGLTVVPIPGPSAVTTLLSVAGLIDGRFRFEGFLPARAGQRRSRLRDLAAGDIAVILFEAPHRIEDLARDLAASVEPARRVVVGRELTKRFEQIVSLEAGEFEAWLAADPDRRRGEFVLAIHPAAGVAAAGAGLAGIDAAGAPGSGPAAGRPAGPGTDLPPGLATDPAANPATGPGAVIEPPPPALPSPLGQKALAILAEKLPPREAARLAGRISGDDADLLYRFRAGQRSRASDP